MRRDATLQHAEGWGRGHQVRAGRRHDARTWRRGPLATSSPESLFARDREIANEADLFVMNLSVASPSEEPGGRHPARPSSSAPPSAAEALAVLGVDCVSLANNHALDFCEALRARSTISPVGIAWAGAGADVDRAREPAVPSGGFRLGVLSLCR